MFRRPQDHEPDPETSQLGRILSPLRISTWGPVAMSYLGVPILPIVVVQDKDFEKATRKLEDSGFIPSSPNRNPAPEIMAGLLDPQAVLRQIKRRLRARRPLLQDLQLPEPSTRELSTNTFDPKLICQSP
ncbi:hypothetical protein I7I50_05047 [Histoplasma capsulatum G186AR]|nr:hypothetical protein I7I52_03305 [Histoplasma capsulatum]QSS75788.1 hypothetical protein I7I50_05047 [Histoplasma capsulatum G186AR]